MLKTDVKTPIVIALTMAAMTYAAPSAMSSEVSSTNGPSQTLARRSLSTFAIGEVKVGKKVFTTSKIIIKATPAVVWAVLTDYNGAARIFSNLSKSKVVSAKGPTKLVAFSTKSMGNLFKFDYTLEVTERDQELIEWKRSSGAFHANDGYWKLEPIEDGQATLVSYAKHIDGGFFYPQPLVKKLVRESIPEIFMDLKAAAELPRVADHVHKVSL